MIDLIQSLIPFEWISGAVVGLIGFVAVWLMGRNSARREIDAKMAEGRLEAVREAEDVRNEVEALDHDTLRARAAKWVRAPKR